MEEVIIGRRLFLVNQPAGYGGFGPAPWPLPEDPAIGHP